MLKTRIKWIDGGGLGEDSGGGFSYIVSSWFMEEGRKPTVMTSYIATFCPTSLKKIEVFLVVAFCSISSASQY